MRSIHVRIFALMRNCIEVKHDADEVWSLRLTRILFEVHQCLIEICQGLPTLPRHVDRVATFQVYASRSFTS